MKNDLNFTFYPHYIKFTMQLSIISCVFYRKLKNWWRKRDNLIEEQEKLSQWEQDYDLVEQNPQGLFYEYLEMGEHVVRITVVNKHVLLASAVSSLIRTSVR